MPEFVLDLIRPNLVGKELDDLVVFQSPSGKQLRLNTWRRRFWYTAVDRVNRQRELAAAAGGYVFQPFPKVTRTTCVSRRRHCRCSRAAT